ncbi:putative thiamine transport system permease protein [Peteryoungia aggregata LMG 23059]|uniref:Thiamine transport system permease protein n=1 Tax=Peteryoungia aggregata LMG 23059 TaxID=1368425 RepID=A0ABU0G3M1_9HYPH|nr:ABC transporter permease subunit [Peteryoungia aggregata]MDQ0419708.1 putative thiamine transport system permease protein [Peteryoungia aggregata LMG 23059]
MDRAVEDRGVALVARSAVFLTLAFLVLPISFGLLGTLLPAFGYLPALGGHELGLDSFRALFATPGLSSAVLLSLATGLVATALSLITTLIFIAGFAGTPALSRLQHLLSPLLAVPHAAAAFGLAFLIAPSGYLIRLVAPLLGIDRPPDILIPHDPMGLAMIAGLVIKETPFLFLVTLAALPQVDLGSARRLAASFGYGRIAGFVYLLWPALYRQIRFAVYAVIAYSTSVVDMALILGPNLPGTLATRLVQWMNDPDLSARFLASAGAVLQLSVTLGALILWKGLERLSGILLRLCREGGLRFVHDGGLRLMSAISVGAIGGTVFAGIGLLALWSVAGLWQFPDLLPQALTLRSWMSALPRIVDPLVTTLVIGCVSTLIAVTLSLGCLERETDTGRTGGERSLFILYLPLIVPQISFVFGLQLLFIGSGSQHRLAALILVHLVFVLPYVYLSLAEPWRALDRRYEIIATALGKSRMAVLLSIRLPMLIRPILTAGAVGLAVSIGQYLPTLLIGEGRLATITTEAVALASGNNRRVIGVYALLQTILPFLAFTLAALLPAVLHRNRREMRV